MQTQRYDGYRITYRFGDCVFHGLDKFDSADEYAYRCRRALQAAYPGAWIEVYWSNCYHGAHVTAPNGVWYRAGDYCAGARMAAEVEKIAGRVWEECNA